MRLSRAWLVALLAALSAAPLSARAQRDSTPRPTVPRSFLGRILGVFDLTTGEPIEGVEVFDMIGKSSALTTRTGTIALTFVDTAGSVLRLRKVGYDALMLSVSNREGESPITAVMTHAGVVLPTVRSTATRIRGPADTVKKLELNGFYARRDNSGAAPMAFVMGERLQNLATFDDFGKLTGRPICEGNLFVDGIRVKGAQIGEGLGAMGRRIQPKNVRKNLADQFVYPTDVVAIENYRVGEVPVEYNATKGNDASHDCGATLIWTK